MSLPQEIAEQIALNDRRLKRWLMAALLMFMSLVAVFVWWRVDAARVDWFEKIALIDAGGVDVTATVTSKNCKSTGAAPVSYRWFYDGNHYMGSGPPCEKECRKLHDGDEVGLRFIPSRPELLACLRGDIRRQTEAPSYAHALLFLILLCGVVVTKLFEAYRDPPASS